jgi:chromosome segregation ATPase
MKIKFLGSTIEMLRSENVQVRSQLSTIQRRMFQEKQQIMDYLRQIENDLIEKEQIKQRESLLREDYEQLKNSINHDQQKLEALQQEYSQLLKTIQIQNEEKDQFKSGIKHLYSHFHIPIESHDQFYLSFKPIENHFNDLQNQCTQLDEANRAWQQFHQTQLDNFRNKLQNILPIETNFSFDEIAQLIVNYLNKNSHTESIDRESESSSFNPSKQTPSEEVSVQSTPSLINEHDEELRQLRENLTTLTSQCAQFDEANRAWQQYQQTQLDNFRNKLQYYLPLDENIPFDQVAQLIVNQIIKEREEFNQKYQELEKTNNDLLSSNIFIHLSFNY